MSQSIITEEGHPGEHLLERGGLALESSLASVHLYGRLSPGPGVPQEPVAVNQSQHLSL